MKKKAVNKLIKHFKSKKELHQWMLYWCNDDCNMAEFYLYEIFCISKGIQDEGDVPCNTMTIWEHCFKDPHMLKGLVHYVKYLQESAKRMGYDFYVAGLHTHTRKYLDPEDIQNLLSYLDMSDCWPTRGCPFQKQSLNC